MVPTITFLALYRGKTIDEAVLIATSVDAALIKSVVRHLLDAASCSSDAAPTDAVLTSIASGRSLALRLILDEEPAVAKEDS